MENFLNLLNQNSGAVIAIFTGIYVIGTLLMWWEMRKNRQRLDEPNIQILLEPQIRWGNFFDLVVKNLSSVPVYNLKLKIEPMGLKTIGERKLEDINLFKKAIPVFGVGQELRTFAISYVDFIHSEQSKQISFTAEYETLNGKRKIQKYNFDMEIYLNMSASSEKSLKDVTEQIEKLTKEVNKISRYYERAELKQKVEPQ